MTEASDPLPPPAPPPPPGAVAGPRTLRRSTTDRRIAGVCGGLGRYFDVDPLVFRVTLAVLAVFGGAGLLAYGVAWLLVPEEGADESEGERLLRGRSDGGAAAAVVAVLLGLAAVGVLFDSGPGLGGIVLAALAVGLVVAVRQGRVAVPRWASGPARDAGRHPASSSYPSAGPYPPPGPGGPPGDYGRTPGTAWSATATTQPLWAAAPPPHGPHPGAHAAPARPPRARSPLTGLTLSVALLVLGAALAWGLWTGRGLGVGTGAALVLAVVGAGLVTGTWWGRARTLVPVGLLAAAVLAGASTVETPLAAGVGERAWRPVSVAALESPYRLGAGVGRLDLTGLDPAGAVVDVRAELGLGELVVEVPEDVALLVDAHAHVGEVRVPDGTTRNGLGNDLAGWTAPALGPARGTLRLDLQVGLGAVEVRRG